MVRHMLSFCWIFLLWSLQRLEITACFSPFTTRAKYLPQATIETLYSKEWLHCVIACRQRQNCLAYNYNLAKKNCELKSKGIVKRDDEARQLLENTNYIYHQMKPGCSVGLCMNDGHCVQDQLGRDQPLCVCKKGYEGSRCKVKQDVRFYFTNLGSSGAYGPQSNLGYKGTSLENVHVINGIQDWTVPRSGMYHVQAGGASGGNNTAPNFGGRGAVINGTVNMRKGIVLRVLVGQMGQSLGRGKDGSGGGGTYVVFKANGSALIVAGGGGGGGFKQQGDSGQTGLEGSVNGGTSMAGGRVCINDSLTQAGAGGGFESDGRCVSSAPCVQKTCSMSGRSFINGGRGGAKGSVGMDGGFGGGGGSDAASAGGGGGYSGGGVQFSLFGSGAHAGGGGSFASVNSWSASTRNSYGHGYVLFQLII